MEFPDWVQVREKHYSLRLSLQKPEGKSLELWLENISS